jgi:hypothetical protein
VAIIPASLMAHPATPHAQRLLLQGKTRKLKLLCRCSPRSRGCDGATGSKATPRSRSDRSARRGARARAPRPTLGLALGISGSPRRDGPRAWGSSRVASEMRYSETWALASCSAWGPRTPWCSRASSPPSSARTTSRGSTSTRWPSGSRCGGRRARGLAPADKTTY